MVVVLAPHLKYPLRNGGDIYVDRFAGYLSKYRGEVKILGADTLVSYRNGIRIALETYRNRMRSKPLAAIRTVLFRSHYLVEKFLTREYRSAAKKLLMQYPNSLLIYSFISVASLQLTAGSALILTQNDEIEVYRNQRIRAKNPFQKLVASASQEWLINFIHGAASDNLFGHITETDQLAFDRYIPGHKSLIIPAGVEVGDFEFSDEWDGKTRLLFCGSLSAQMNLDALIFFRERFWPTLRKNLKRLEICVCGSNPSPAIHRICKDQGWYLYPNVSDEDLFRLYSSSLFGILPFPYVAGAKIKFLNASAAGLPVLATKNINTLPKQDFPPNLYSDCPDEWLQHLQRYEKTGVAHDQRRICYEYALQYSWENIVSSVDQSLSCMAI